MNDNEFFARMWLLVAIVVLGVATVIAVYNYTANRAFVDGGYCQASLPGVDGPGWVKCP